MLSNKVFTQVMVELSAFFKKDDMSDLYYKNYYKAIQELTDQQCIRGCNHLIKNYKKPYFPLPSEFLQAVVDSKVNEPSQPQTYTPQSRQIEVQYPGIPEDVREMMKVTLEKIKKRGMK